MEKRYLSNFNYNSALILTELEKIVKENGGKIVSTWKHDRRPFAVVNRTILETIHDLEKKKEKFTCFNKIFPVDMENKLIEYKTINNDPVTTYYGDFQYIGFSLNGVYYYYQIDRNPFFDFLYAKTPVINNCIYNNHCTKNDPKEWLFDIFFSCKASDDDRKHAAETIYNMLINSKYTHVYKTTNKMSKLYTVNDITEV